MWKKIEQKSKRVKKKSANSTFYISARLIKPPQRSGGRGGWRLVFSRQMYCTIFKVPVLWTMKALPSSL
jgi:hypothetical protein